ncbi:MAG: hypothetical protein ABSD85_12430 [Acidimicrobiales bacterium]|jgi:hypothetical protein
MNDHNGARWRRRRARIAKALPIAVLLGIATCAAACSGGPAAPNVASIGSTTTTTSATGTAASNGQPNLQQAYQAQLAYAQCMRAHGVPNFPDPTLTSHAVSFGAGHNINQDSPQFVSASTTCKRLVPDGGPPSTAQLQAAIARLLKNAQCMRTHGVPNFPDPIVSAHNIGIFLKGVDPNSPGFQAAQRTCQKLAPIGGIG